MPAASNHSITPASGSSAIRPPRFSAAPWGCCWPMWMPKHPCDYLERLATKIDDTHVDLAATQTWGFVKGGSRVAIEIAVSKAKLNWLDGYIVCIRDITERHLAESVGARKRGALPHAGGACSRSDRRVRRRWREVRRRQRQRLPLLQDEPRQRCSRADRTRSVRRRRPTARLPSACRAATSTVLWPARCRCSIGCTAIPPVRIFPAKCGSCVCRVPAGGCSERASSISPSASARMQSPRASAASSKKSPPMRP